MKDNVTRITVDLTDGEIQMIGWLIHKYEPTKVGTSEKIFEAYKNGISIDDTKE